MYAHCSLLTSFWQMFRNRPQKDPSIIHRPKCQKGKFQIGNVLINRFGENQEVAAKFLCSLSLLILYCEQRSWSWSQNVQTLKIQHNAADILHVYLWRSNVNFKNQIWLEILKKSTHLIEDHAKFGPNKAVDQKIDGGVDHKEYVREKPDKGDDGSIGYNDGDVITLMLLLMFMMVMFFL